MDAGHHSLQGLDAEGHPDGTAAVDDEKWCMEIDEERGEERERERERNESGTS